MKEGISVDLIRNLSPKQKEILIFARKNGREIWLSRNLQEDYISVEGTRFGEPGDDSYIIEVQSLHEEFEYLTREAKGHNELFRLTSKGIRAADSVEAEASGFLTVTLTEIATDAGTIPSDAGEISQEWWSDIHCEIIRVSQSRYDTGHYSDAVEAAMKEVNCKVKAIYLTNSGTESDGSDLMLSAFSPKNPTIVIGDLATQSGQSMQQGYMQLFAGAMLGIRNPKAHENINITAQRARHFIYLASLLLHKLDESSHQIPVIKEKKKDSQNSSEKKSTGSSPEKVKRKMELAEEAIELFSKMPGIIGSIRDPIVFEKEISEDGNLNDFQRIRSRFLKSLTAFEEFTKFQNQFLAYFGEEQESSFNAVQEVISTLHDAAYAVNFVLDDYKSKYKILTEVLWCTDPKDKLRAKTLKARDDITNYCRTFLQAN